MSKVLFLHGLFGSNSSKPYFIKSWGFEVFNPILDDWNFKKAVQTSQEIYDKIRPDLIVGSSRGGAIAINMNSGSTPLILLAPAWPYFGNKDMTKENSTIIHSQNDKMISIKHSIKLAEKSNCKLIIAGQDHRLNCQEGQKALKESINNYFI